MGFEIDDIPIASGMTSGVSPRTSFGQYSLPAM